MDDRDVCSREDNGVAGPWELSQGPCSRRSYRRWTVPATASRSAQAEHVLHVWHTRDFVSSQPPSPRGLQGFFIALPLAHHAMWPPLVQPHRNRCRTQSHMVTSGGEGRLVFWRRRVQGNRRGVLLPQPLQ